MALELAKLNDAVADEMSKMKAVVDLPELIEDAKSLDIIDDGSYAIAGELNKKLRTVLSSADDERKKLTDPLNGVVKRLNAAWHDLVDPVAEIRKSLIGRMETYAEMKRRREQEEARKAQEILMRAALKAEKDNKPELAEAALSVAVRIEDKPTQTVKTGTATTFSRKIYQSYLVTDFDAVPMEYKTVDESRVRAAYQRGVRSIPGLKILEKESIISK